MPSISYKNVRCREKDAELENRTHRGHPKAYRVMRFNGSAPFVKPQENDYSKRSFKSDDNFSINFLIS